MSATALSGEISFKLVTPMIRLPRSTKGPNTPSKALNFSIVLGLRLR